MLLRELAAENWEKSKNSQLMPASYLAFVGEKESGKSTLIGKIVELNMSSAHSANLMIYVAAKHSSLQNEKICHIWEIGNYDLVKYLKVPPNQLTLILVLDLSKPNHTPSSILKFQSLIVEQNIFGASIICTKYDIYQKMSEAAKTVITDYINHWGVKLKVAVLMEDKATTQVTNYLKYLAFGAHLSKNILLDNSSPDKPSCRLTKSKSDDCDEVANFNKMFPTEAPNEEKQSVDQFCEKQVDHLYRKLLNS